MNNKDEAQRLDALHGYNILDTLTEEDYENITFLASVICDVPIALISFVDKDRQWFKSHRGIALTETEREYSFCAHAIQSIDEVLIVDDARNDPRFQTNPLVTGDPNIVFYAGVPLVDVDGFGLGTVCVIDNKKRHLSENQIKSLKILSQQAMDLLGLRKIVEELDVLSLNLEIRNKELEQFAMVVSHDIKSPLSSVILANTLLAGEYSESLGTDGLQLVTTSNNSANKIKTLVDGILSYYRDEKDLTRYEEIDLKNFFDGFRPLMSLPRNYSINYSLDSESVYFNKTLLEQIFFNLITNSIRYNDNPVAEIDIHVNKTDKKYQFTVADNGIGIKEEFLPKIFDLFTTVSTTDSFGIKSSGIGLPTVKKIVENSGGNIRVISTPGEGTIFFFTLGIVPEQPAH